MSIKDELPVGQRFAHWHNVTSFMHFGFDNLKKALKKFTLHVSHAEHQGGNLNMSLLNCPSTKKQLDYKTALLEVLGQL